MNSRRKLLFENRIEQLSLREYYKRRYSLAKKFMKFSKPFA